MSISWEQIKKDAEPKSDKVRNVVAHLLDTKTVSVTKGLSYNAVVSTVGVAANLSAPAISKMAKGWTNLKQRLEKLAEPPTKK